MTTTTKCRKHEWTPLFRRPSTPEVAAAFVGPVPFRGEVRVCAACGILGFLPAGYSRGGGHTVRRYQYQDGLEQYVKDAEAWNAALAEFEAGTEASE
jgi:hypothetical protein